MHQKKKKKDVIISQKKRRQTDRQTDACRFAAGLIQDSPDLREPMMWLAPRRKRVPHHATHTVTRWAM